MKFTKKEIEILQGSAIINTIMSLRKSEGEGFGYDLSDDEAQKLVDKLESLT